MFIKEALSINALRACVYIYIRQLSSFRAPTWWFIDLTVTACHIQYTFLSLCEFVSGENWTEHKNTQSPPCLNDTKMVVTKIKLPRKDWNRVISFRARLGLGLEITNSNTNTNPNTNTSPNPNLALKLTTRFQSFLDNPILEYPPYENGRERLLGAQSINPERASVMMNSQDGESNQIYK